MTFRCLDDHLSGFDKNFHNSRLAGFPDESVYTEYILPDYIKKKYKTEIKFSALLMVRNNNFVKFVDLPEPAKQPRTNFLCTFNKSPNPGRVQFVMALITAGLFSPNFSTKCFSISHLDWAEFYKTLPKHVIDTNLDLRSVADHIEETIYLKPDLKNGMIKETNQLFSPMISNSFITAICEPVPESYVPFPTEKFCYPVLNKSLWLSYAQPGYHKFLAQYCGIRSYEGIHYEFDSIEDPHARLCSYVTELLRLSRLSPEEQSRLYSVNEEIIQHNFETLTSGQLVANIWMHDDMCKEYSDLRGLELDPYVINEQLMFVVRALGKK